MKYLKSHPWLSFKLSMDLSDYELWLKFGEVASKCEHLLGVPLRPEIAEELNRVFLTKGVMATTAIEGNTLTEEQVRKQVDGELNLPPSQAYLQQEITNIIDACNQVTRELIEDKDGSTGLCVQRICSYNSQVLRELTLEEEVVPGVLRTNSVIVGNVYRGAPAEDCEYLLDRLCDWLNGSDFVAPNDDLKVPYALIRSIVAHVYLAWIHPFGDGNGRTARLMEFQILFSSGLPLPAAHLLSDHYNRTRTQYYRELNHSSKSGGDLMPFVKYAIQGILDGLRGQIGRVRAHQMDAAWENYVHRKFRDKRPSPTQKRRRDLVLELSDKGWVKVAKIEEISPKIAVAYAGAGNKMKQRDLNELQKMGLVIRQKGSVLAQKMIIAAFLPSRVERRDSDDFRA